MKTLLILAGDNNRSFHDEFQRRGSTQAFRLAVAALAEHKLAVHSRRGL
jgi:hypothetical protein